MPASAAGWTARSSHRLRGPSWPKRRRRDEHKTIAAYGAPAKGNTLLNACGAAAADIAYVADRNPHKQGLYLPGSHLPVHDPEIRIAARPGPDYVLILPWNLQDRDHGADEAHRGLGRPLRRADPGAGGAGAMKLGRTKLPGVFYLEIAPLSDARGYFARTFCAESLREAGAAFGAVRQMSISVNDKAGTLRGMHWQAEPKPEAKIVRPTAGRIFDVALDLRPASPTFRQWFGTELDAARHDALLIPAGCAHGFVTLENACAIEYLMDADYAPELARGVRWDDPAFAIAWPIAPAS